jgi:hypothetical protein
MTCFDGAGSWRVTRNGVGVNRRRATISGPPKGQLDEQREVAQVERAVGRSQQRGRVRPSCSKLRRDQFGIGQSGERKRHPGHDTSAFVPSHRLDEDDLLGADVNRVSVVVRHRLRLCRLRFVVVIVVVTAGAVMVMTVVVSGWNMVRVDVGPEIVSGGLWFAVRVTERC